ncbi:MAG: DAK2 domain-containing protein, partial [Lachnoanaerobaculum sp.]|nr:DAK2 domain-containing protein [Lachnoanaerobaculum sp.]
MTEIRMEDLPELFEFIAKVFVEKKDELCAMDANMGDGDLGLTMSKGYSAMPDLIRENTVENNVGKTLFKAGMKMASVVPSTMGTLMASGIMEAGKSLNEKDKIDAKDLALYFESFAAGIKKRGKCEAGDRTIY